MNEKIRSVLVNPSFSIKQTMEVIDKSALGIALVVENSGKLIGVVTDGDIRRAIIKEISLNEKVSNLISKNPIVLHRGYNSHHVLRVFSEFGKRIKHIPVIDEMGRVVDLLSYTDYFELKDNQNIVVRAKAPLRVSFAGGGTDVNQYMNTDTGIVLSSTINKHCYGSLLRRSDRKIIIHSIDYNLTVEIPSIESIKYDGKLDLVKAVLSIMKPSYGMDLCLRSDVPPGTGLGGSSSVVAVVIGLLNYFRAKKLDEYQIAQMAYQAERIELGIAGGWQDQYAAVFGGFNFMEFSRDDIVVHPLKLKPDLLNELEYHLLLCYTGKTRNSGEIVKKQTDSFVAGKKEVIEAFEGTKRISNLMKNALLKGKLQDFAHLLHLAWQEKKKFNSMVTNDRIDTLYNVGLENGAIGGKVLGAGGGGYILFFCSDGSKEIIRQKLIEENAAITDFNFDFSGLQVWPGTNISKLTKNMVIGVNDR